MATIRIANINATLFAILFFTLILPFSFLFIESTSIAAKAQFAERTDRRYAADPLPVHAPRDFVSAKIKAKSLFEFSFA